MLNRLVPWYLLASISVLGSAGCGDDSAPVQDTSQPDQADTSAPVDTYVPPPDIEQPPVCSSFQCVDGVASECGGGLSLECGRFYGQCTTFQGEAGVDGWCDCGRLAEGEAVCLTDSSGVICDRGLGVPFDCVAGAMCATDPSGGVECACDNRSDGVCPDSGCTGDPDCSACTPSCGGRECGGNGCGGSCGSCGLGETCDGSQCVCKPSCEDKQCGDDGCGGSCGSCEGGTSCSFGQCVMAPPEDLLHGQTMGRVDAFDVSSTHVYFIAIGLDGRYHAFRCPNTGCTGAPEDISGPANASSTGAAVELAGNEVFWTRGPKQIWRADVGGGALGAGQQAYDGLGATVVDMDGDGSSVFAIASDWLGGNRQRLLVEIPGNGGSYTADASTLSFLATNMQTDIARFDVSDYGVITVWAGYAGNPQPIYSIGPTSTDAVSPASESVGDLLRIGSQIVWTQGSSADGAMRILTCGVTDCATPYVVATTNGVIATDGSRLYFTQGEGGTSHLRSCDSLDLLIESCTPTTHSSGYAWTGAYKLRIKDGYAYGGGQMGLVRTRL